MNNEIVKLSGMELVNFNKDSIDIVDYGSNSYQASSTSNPLYTGTTQGITYHITYPDYYYYHEHYYPVYYPCCSWITEKSKVEQAFKIVGKLIEKKLIKDNLNVKDFIKLVNDISEII